MEKLVIAYMGDDSWSRPVYVDDAGKLYCDTDPRPTSVPNICTKYNNEFDGEPNNPVSNREIVFKPNRITW